MNTTNPDPGLNFKKLLKEELSVRDNSVQENFHSESSERLFSGIPTPPTKWLKKDKNDLYSVNELELENSDAIKTLVQEFFKAALAIGSTVPPPPSWKKVSLILSLFAKMITDSPATFGLTLALGGDISDTSSILKNAPQITISTIFDYVKDYIDISCHEIWLGITSFMLIFLKDYPQTIIDLQPYSATDIIKKILYQIDQLPVSLNKIQFECVNKGKLLIDALLIGKGCGGVGYTSHYQVIEQLQEIYNIPVRSCFLQVHWTLEEFVFNDLSNRRRRLAFLMMPPEGRAASHTSRFRDLLFQRAPIDEIKAMSKKINRSEPIRKALFSKVHDVIISIQKRSNFNEPRQDLGDISKEKMLFPDNLDFFELMIELGDQLYGLVASDDIKYEEVVTKFYYMVYPKYGEHSSDHLNTVPKDNILIWLLLQLFQIERIGSGIIPRDLGSDERLFSMLVKLYNEQQVVSKDAFYLRDLSLQCAILHQHSNIRGSNLKTRHPQLLHALSYLNSIKELQSYFPNKYKKMMKMAIFGQTKHNILADTLYVYLVPDKLVETGKLGFPETTFLKGGAAGYKLLDLININHKHRMLLFDGETTPKVPPEVKEQNSNKFLCVSPHALDVVYKIVYSAPWS
ncbi:11952_t:CDS:10 [Entrophospora sp. SA101]